ncbi:protein-tyrosine phosphatase family protein [Candidatus Poriferisodalis sp.]|uniref:protein-tyrosine phosphatase family protein n=1 Tax=Candidatus Poriferisodalis sp. TaxID=3101277 RepID=UPI003C6FBA52
MLHRIDEIPLKAAQDTGRLFVTNFSAVGPDAQAALDRVGASVLVCMLTSREIELRYPEYGVWLESRSDETGNPRALWLPTPDGSVTSDEPVLKVVASVVAAMERGDSVLVHCGAGMARTAVIGILTMVAFGADPATAAVDFRAARPGGGPDGPPQEHQIARLRGAARQLQASS